jgi:hypothetical protein
VVGLGEICKQLDLSCHLRKLRRRLTSLGEHIHRRLATLVLEDPEGEKLKPSWGGGYWTTYSRGLPSIDAKYISMQLVQRLVGGSDKECAEPANAGSFDCDWAQLASAQSGYDRLNNLYDGTANLNRFSMPSLVTTILAQMEAKMEAKTATLAAKNVHDTDTDPSPGACGTDCKDVVAETCPGDADVKMLFGHDVQVRFLGEILEHVLFASGQIWAPNTATYASTVGLRLQSRAASPDSSAVAWRVQPVFFVSNPQTMHSPSAGSSGLLTGPIGPPLAYADFRRKLLTAVTPECTFVSSITKLLQQMKASEAERAQAAAPGAPGAAVQ